MSQHRCLECESLYIQIGIASPDLLLCHHCPLPLLLVDAHGRFRQINDVFISYFGADQGKISSHSGFNLFSTPFIGSLSDLDIRDALQAKQTVKVSVEDFIFPAEFCTMPLVEHANQRMEITFLPIETDYNQYILSAFNPLPEREKELEYRIRRHQTVSFAKVVAELKHELSNPLLLITGNAQLLLAKDDLPPNVTRKLEKIFSGAEKIKETLDQFMISTEALYLKNESTKVN